MSQFEYAMVLELFTAHAAWLGVGFLWLVRFWWWEFRFASRVAD